MGSTEFSNYYNKPCRFKLKSGKEVFGVIWEDIVNGNKEYFFASSSEYQAFIKSGNLLNPTPKLRPIKMDISEVLAAKRIEI